MPTKGKKFSYEIEPNEIGSFTKRLTNGGMQNIQVGKTLQSGKREVTFLDPRTSLFRKSKRRKK